MRHSALAPLAGLTLLAAAGFVLYRRMTDLRRAGVALYFEDGSMVSYAARSGEARRLLLLAEEALRVARAG